MREFYLSDCPDPEPIRSQKLKKHGKEAYEAHNKMVAQLLIDKGFDKFTIDMALRAGAGGDTEKTGRK